jgi:LacI family transcriptional regulator
MKKKRIAVIMEFHPFRRHYEILEGVQDYVKEHDNWELEVSNYPEHEIMNGKHFDGIVGRITRKCYHVAHAANIPMVNVMVGSSLYSKVPGVYVDFQEAGRVAAKHLIARGLRNLTQFSYNQRAGSLHYKGMLEIAQEYGYPCSRHKVTKSFEATSEDWAALNKKILKCLDSWQAPMGLATTTDELSRAIAIITSNAGWRIPEDLAIISCHNNLLVCNKIEPSLSSIDMGHHQGGYEAARQLDNIIQGRQITKQQTLTPLKGLVVRRTSDVFSVSDSTVEKALRYMADHSSEAISVPIVARAAGIGRQSLERRFKKYIGRTINDELIRLRIEALKRLLVESDTPVNILSAEVGFGTTVNMYTMFKRATDTIPSEYRRIHRRGMN